MVSEQMPAVQEIRINGKYDNARYIKFKSFFLILSHPNLSNTLKTKFEQLVKILEYIRWYFKSFIKFSIVGDNFIILRSHSIYVVNSILTDFWRTPWILCVTVRHWVKAHRPSSSCSTKEISAHEWIRHLIYYF